MTHSSRENAYSTSLLGDSEASSFRRLIGRLLYLTNTRPNIVFVVHHLSQFVSFPTNDHRRVALKILFYLKNNPGRGIFISNKGHCQIRAYSDADWAACPKTRKSIIDLLVYIGDSIVSWKTKNQITISCSSCEAEYRALAATVCEVQWISYVLNDLRFSHTKLVPIFCDNQSAIYIANNQVYHERTKHIEIDCHLTREKIQSGFIKLLLVSSSLQLVDILTKPLQPNIFSSLCSKLGVLDIYNPNLKGA